MPWHLLGNLDQLGHTTQPHDVGLENVDRSVLDQFPETILGVLVFTRSELDVWEILLQLDVSVKVVRV